MQREFDFICVLDIIQYDSLDNIKKAYGCTKDPRCDWSFFIRESIKYGRIDAVKYFIDLQAENADRDFLIMVCIFHNSGEGIELVNKKYRFGDALLQEIMEYAEENRRTNVVMTVKKMLKIKEN